MHHNLEDARMPGTDDSGAARESHLVKVDPGPPRHSLELPADGVENKLLVRGVELQEDVVAAFEVRSRDQVEAMVLPGARGVTKSTELVKQSERRCRCTEVRHRACGHDRFAFSHSGRQKPIAVQRQRQGQNKVQSVADFAANAAAMAQPGRWPPPSRNSEPAHSGHAPGEPTGVRPAHWCFAKRRRSSAFSAWRRPISSSILSAVTSSPPRWVSRPRAGDCARIISAPMATVREWDRAMPDSPSADKTSGTSTATPSIA